MKAKNLFKVALVTLLFWIGQGSVMAGMVVYEDIGFMSTNETSSQLESFTIGNAGAYQIKLMDFSFPESFKSLGVLIARDSSDGYQEVIRLDTQGEKVFDADAGTYYAALFGQTGDMLGIGLYGIKISQLDLPAPVPLPAALWLLGSALASLFVLKRKSNDACVTVA